MITSGEGKYKVFLEKKQHDEDLIYILGGGEKSHIGGVVICEPDKETQVLKLEGHYDYMVLQPIAEEACKKYKEIQNVMLFHKYDSRYSSNEPSEQYSTCLANVNQKRKNLHKNLPLPEWNRFAWGIRFIDNSWTQHGHLKGTLHTRQKSHAVTIHREA